jgi:hypothetical protein
MIARARRRSVVGRRRPIIGKARTRAKRRRERVPTSTACRCLVCRRLAQSDQGGAIGYQGGPS